MRTLLRNGKVVTPQYVIDSCDVLLDGEKIALIDQSIDKKYRVDEVIELGGAFLMPGFIDIHSDMIENLIEPRSTALMDFELSLKESEKQLLSSGITTIFHSVSLLCQNTWGDKKIRMPQNVKRLSQMIREMSAREHLIHHRLHLRYEIDNIEGYADVFNMLQSGNVHLLSFMDHSPGQGQYRNLEIYKKHLPDGGKHFTKEEFLVYVEREKSKAFVPFDNLRELVMLANKHHISVASHDDDTKEKIRLNKALGIDISEFPITLETAEDAKRQGLFTVLGAPNILLGGSHSGNLAAAEAILKGVCDVLCSDYYPSSLLHAIFYMVKNYQIKLHTMVNMLTINPARAARIDDRYGAIEVGKMADLLVVRDQGDYPVIERSFVHGKMASSLCYQI